MPLRDRIEVEFVEAGVEAGFNLVDLAEKQSLLGDPSVASRVLHDLDAVLHEIDQRLSRLADRDRAPFDPLVAELRREFELAMSRNSARGA